MTGVPPPRGRTVSGLVTLGETMAALSPDHVGPLRHARSLGLSVAGAESTVAIGVCRLGHPATWIGRVGDDELGALVRARLLAEGVTVHAVTDPAAPTGLMIKERRAAGVRRVHYYRSGSAGSQLTPDDLPDQLAEVAVLHLTGITPALSPTAAAAVRAAVAQARAAGRTVSFDVNFRSRLWTADTARPVLAELAATADLVFAGVEEAQIVLGSAATDPAELGAALRAIGPSTVVVKLGEQGAVSFSEAGAVPVDAVPVTEVDPVGAGDSFVAGYLAALLDGRPEADRMAQAATVAAMSVATHGDWEGLPTRSELGLLAGTIAR